MKYEDLYKLSKAASVFALHNTIENKYYVCKAIKAQKEMKKIIREYPNENSKLYEAIRKYGLDNFDLIIIKNFKTGQGDYRLTPYINSLTEEYINKFDSINNGYNETNNRISTTK